MLNSTPKPLGAHLVEQGIISPTELDAALKEQSVTRERLGRVLVKRGFITQAQLIDALRALGAEAELDNEVFGSELPANLLKRTETMLVAKTDDAFLLGTLSPEVVVRAMLDPYRGTRKLDFVPVDRVKLQRYLDKLENTSVSGVLENMLAKAVSDRVSDIHIVPKDGSYSTFYRYLGVRQLQAEGSLEEYAQLAARIKDRARLDIAERRVPQDGAFSMTFAGRAVDFRVATVPTSAGEYIVIRVLDPESASKKLNTLGITRLDEWLAGCSRPDGLCLICGPTGSGKTTTLNATVREMDRFGQAIFSAEDPVEYNISYTGQVNINPGVGLDFARALKAFMRADPDIIILGEIRDQETARSAVKLAETGHLVLATLHTESIFGATQRLQDIGVPRYELSYLLRSVLVQRLMRTTCPHCLGAGCPACRHAGYAGRTIISECAYFPDSQSVSEMLEGKRDWPTMIEDALLKVRAGETDEREFKRIFRFEAEKMLAAEKLEGDVHGPV